MTRLQTVALDFDGVIHDYHSGYQDGSIYGGFLPGAYGSILQLMSQHPVCIITARDPVQTATWLTTHGFACTTEIPDNGFWDVMGQLLVTNQKLPAAVYVDDRAVKFASWGQALTDIRYALLIEARSPD